MDLTAEMLTDLWPHGDSKIDGLIAGIVESAPAVFEKYGLASPLLVAHFMAQVSHECGAGTEVVENLNYSAQGLQATWPHRFDASKASLFAHQPQRIANEVYNGRMGNDDDSDDGWNFRGRGACQTTGKDAYQKLGDIIGADLISNPDAVNDPAQFLECGAADFVKICGCLPFAENDDIVGVTKHLNGGLIGEPQREAWLDKWKDALGA